MKVALYARTSTNDRDQNPETQLMALRDFARAQGWEVVGEYVDRAPANDLAHRTAWRELLDDAARRRFQAVVVFKLDRAFRSVKHMHDTLAAWEKVGVGFQSVREGFDTRTALGRLVLHLLASLSELELEVLPEQVCAGMERVPREGKRVGRPPVTARPGFCARLEAVRAELQAGRLSKRQAARRLGVGVATLYRLLQAEGSRVMTARPTGCGKGDPPRPGRAAHTCGALEEPATSPPRSGPGKATAPEPEGRPSVCQYQMANPLAWPRRGQKKPGVRPVPG